MLKDSCKAVFCCLPCSAAASAGGNTEWREDMAPAEKKWPFDFGFGLPWAASGFGTDLVQCWARQLQQRGTLVPPPRHGCVITGFSLDKETPLAAWLAGWRACWLAGWSGASCLDASPSITSFNNAGFKHASDMKEHHTFFNRLHFSTNALIWQPGQWDHVGGIGWWIKIE